MISRQTRQKGLLRKEVSKMDTFFDARILFGRSRKADPSIGIATVYRFLKSEGLHSFSCGASKVYSAAEKSHCHFTCQKCGTVSHIPIKDITSIRRGIRGSICHFQVDVSGVCERCGGLG